MGEKVLSHNLCTALNVPHNTAALEEHFLGIIKKNWVEEGRFVKENCNELCRMLTAKKKLQHNGTGLLSERDTFKLWCLFNFLSEDSYPLVIVKEEGYMWKKGHVRWNWNERWFILKICCISYYINEDLREKSSWIRTAESSSLYLERVKKLLLQSTSTLLPLADKEGNRCLFCIRTSNRKYEISASDTKCISTAFQVLNKPSLHKKQKARRREQREEIVRKQRELELQQLKELQEVKEMQLQHLEELRQRRKEQEEMQRALQKKLQEVEEAKSTMRMELAQKEVEAEKQSQRIQELEKVQLGLEEALEAEMQARADEQAVRSVQASLLQEEEEKLAELMKLKTERQELSLQEREQVPRSRQLNDQHLTTAQKKLRRASRYVKHWNIQLNRLMQPVTPGVAHDPQ
ncbi:LOW QUALITY PROTEIN: differentially expressed in FDCP 6-like [Callorhinchus milii]|uniref:LOW QUALITY PROTEIN: differentially expressed in FDCP 6-like n=1 Tax=Callorhinchus milii TaxID=7868 RepID=UPI001C3F8C83|nr:LOW QUALITY PROTEIN: differentially expressed in FDCP 6-like [Callorhinchus milii]